MKAFKEFLLAEVSPSGSDAEKWIKDNKEEFKKKYGKDWESVLYATSWKIFGDKK